MKIVALRSAAKRRGALRGATLRGGAVRCDQSVEKLIGWYFVRMKMRVATRSVAGRSAALRSEAANCSGSWHFLKENHMAEKFPLDFDAIEKGSVIEESQCRKIIKHSSETEYQLGLLKLKSLIEDRLQDRGVVVTIKCHKGALVILTDSEASEYNEERQKHSLKAFAVSHRRLIGVDTARLNSEQKMNHERRLVQGGLFLSAINDTRKKILELPPSKEPDRPRL